MGSDASCDFVRENGVERRDDFGVGRRRRRLFENADGCLLITVILEKDDKIAPIRSVSSGTTVLLIEYRSII